MAGRTLLFYDAGCGLCASLMRWVRRADRARRIDFVPLDSPQAEPFLGDLDPRLRSASMHVVTPEGERASAGLAGLRLLEAIPLSSGAARLLGARPAGRAAAERLYRFLVRVRDGLAGGAPVTPRGGTSGPSGSS